jgi:hypothetical protein
MASEADKVGGKTGMMIDVNVPNDLDQPAV